jgi:hypothetical protein
MTEADWDTATDPGAMLTLAAPRVSDRKLRLYLVGCCRRRWELFTDERCREAVAIAERFADGRADDADLAHGVRLARQFTEREFQGLAVEVVVEGELARHVASAAWAVCEQAASLRRVVRHESTRIPRVYAAEVTTHLAVAQVGTSLRASAYSGTYGFQAALAAESAALADLLRCVFGNPFVYTVPEPRWRTSDVNGLARAIYAGRAFDRLPILADALEEAGCDDADVLDHCRRHCEHARGCWVVDLLLDKS